jgi:hypothetical protein
MGLVGGGSVEVAVDLALVLPGMEGGVAGGMWKGESASSEMMKSWEWRCRWLPGFFL